MPPISTEPDTVKIVHTYGVGLHSTEPDADVHDPRWQQRQILEFVDFTALAEELGFDGVTLTEHHAPMMTCPSPHLLLAAAAMKTSRIRLGTAVTVLPLYNPIRVAEEAGTLDLLSDGRFELGIGRGIPGEVALTAGHELSEEQLGRLWLESIQLLQTALTERDFTFDGEFWQVTKPTTIATRPLQEPLPVWLGGASAQTMALAAERGWNVMRNFGSHDDHRQAFEHYAKVAAEHGHSVSGANMMVERFVAVGRDEAAAERSLERMAGAYGRFVTLYTAGGKRTVPATDAEYHVEDTPKQTGRPAIAVSGTPEQIVDELGRTLEETGAHRLIVETFSTEDLELFAAEVMPALKQKYALR